MCCIFNACESIFLRKWKSLRLFWLDGSKQGWLCPVSFAIFSVCSDSQEPKLQCRRKMWATGRQDRPAATSPAPSPPSWHLSHTWPYLLTPIFYPSLLSHTPQYETFPSPPTCHTPYSQSQDASCPRFYFIDFLTLSCTIFSKAQSVSSREGFAHFYNHDLQSKKNWHPT